MAREYAFRYDQTRSGHYAPALLSTCFRPATRHQRGGLRRGSAPDGWPSTCVFTSPRNHLSSAGLGTMGFGSPAAIGAKMSRPDDEVVLVSGDGSFMMNVGARHHPPCPLKVKMVLLDNQRLGMVRQWQELFFDGRQRDQSVRQPDFSSAAAFGIPVRPSHARKR